MSKKPKLYDHSGQPITPSDNQINDGLPPGVQALIEARLNSAIGDIREHNRDDLQDLARAQVKKWRFLTFLSTAIALIAFFIAPQQIVNWIGKQIDKKLTEPMIRESADRLIDTKMSNYVDMKMQPLNKQAGILDANISELKNDIADKQATLQRQQKELADQIKVRELAVAAKAGSRKAYNELLTLKERKPNNLVTSSIKEIELFFDADRGQLSFPILVKKEIMKDPGMSVDEVIQILRSNPKLAEAAINTLSQLKSKASVSELCTLIKTTEDLRLAARATRAIEIITVEKIDPLDFLIVQFFLIA